MVVSNSDLVSPEDVAQWPLHDAVTAHAVFEALQTQLKRQGLPMRNPPATPTTCCGRGCNGCVWEGFVVAAQYWRDEALRVLMSPPSQGDFSSMDALLFGSADDA